MSTSTLVNGVLIGGLYAIVALGLSLVFGVLRLINLAHGELVVGGAYLALLLGEHLGLGPWTALLLVAVVAATFGYMLQRSLLTGLMLKGAEPALVGTFGLSLLGQAAFAAAFTSNTQSLSSTLSTSGLVIAGVRLRTIYVVAFFVAIALTAGLHLVLTRTRLGATIRAAAADASTAQLLGINVRSVYAVVFGLAAALAGVGGVLYGVASSFTPTTGPALLLVGFAVVVLGGVGNVFGTLVAGLSLGLIQALGVSIFGGGYSNLVVYVVFIAVLVVRPTGMFGRAAR